MDRRALCLSFLFGLPSVLRIGVGGKVSREKVHSAFFVTDEGLVVPLASERHYRSQSGRSSTAPSLPAEFGYILRSYTAAHP